MNKIILELLEDNKLKDLHELLRKSNPVDLAEEISLLDETIMVIVFRLLEKEQAAEVFSYMESDDRNKLVKIFSKSEIVGLIDSMYADDAVDFLADMPANVVTHLLDNTNKEQRQYINHLLQYSEDSVGSIMTVEYVELNKNMNVKQALDKIRRVGIDSETIYTCYVIDKKKCIGIITAKDLILNDPEVKISELMKTDFIYALTSDDREDAANKLSKYGLIVMPVLDNEGFLVGIVTFDDALEVLEDEATEDMQKMAAIVASDKPYLSTSIWEHAKNRIGWLLILMFSATITGTIISRYEHAFEAVPILVSFIPMLMDTGGNCGSQSSTLIIRGLAVNEIKYTDMWRVVWKEFGISLIVSAVLAVANGIRIYIMYKNIALSLVVSFSLIGTVVLSKLVGAILPIGAKQLKLDPAVMASPVITTIVDTISIIIYFYMATTILHI
ncbi:MAG: magnesium transporter [Erysipelotrichaceae bacterium]|nr:magnesium transporter [Erysipelotrichaceae bacterium]